ncbi:GNAT family N-acetyltransferase [Waterburya agarophytonicola K14]|uniref:GNAT family N-acetyltransferase n=1 Tax=Waterburya agarophytonicola KI4 TaxID=2874699 RepID=A0A964BTL0_9CYAN|nr:GNAT family N-acetyltransferase [Waterburya agarophytonicola]MCC0178477.1 GNAT family N-acetyltransferase [Waterburya agarophytonicola KI4]
MVLESDVNHNLRLNIHQASIEDTRTISSILAKSFYDFPNFAGWVYPFLQFTINEDLRYRLRSRSPLYACVVAKLANSNLGQTIEHNLDRGIVGTVEISLRSASFWSNETQYPYISNLAVKQDYRRLGIGSQLLAKCEEIALDWGYKETYLHVLDKNDSAKQLYCHSGYQISQIDINWSNLWFDYSPRLLLKKQI